MKTYVKTKEFGPVGGGHVPETFVCRSATIIICKVAICTEFRQFGKMSNAPVLTKTMDMF